MIVPSPEACEAHGARLAATLAAPCVVALHGDLGAGKTCFARGFVAALAAGADIPVSSPTWAVCNTYETSPRVHHLDLYRLETEDDLESIGFWELLDDAIVLIEWPDRVGAVARHVDVRVTLTATSATVRQLEIEPVSERGASMLATRADSSST